MHPSLILRNAAGKQALKAGAKRDPELYILGGVVTAALGGAGYFFASNPTGAQQEDTMAWHGSDPHAAFSHPENTDAPSALHSVTIPNVNLPKELHERFNKHGKSEY